jgi:hypothetical protein
MNYLLLFEEYQKMNWEIITSNPQKRLEGERLIDIVNNAYRNTNLGSFVKTMSDVLKSHWFVIDCDIKDDIDACIFYRESKRNETWKGGKIQGIGHDGDYIAKKLLIEKLVNILNNKVGFWIEASDVLESILVEKGAKRVKDVDIIYQLFPNSDIVILKDGQYKRTLEDGSWVRESIFGIPILRENIN